MHRNTVIALLGAIVMAVAASGAALAAGSGPAVTRAGQEPVQDR